MQVDAFRDAVLKFTSRNGRSLFVLLRRVESRNLRPIVILEKQPLLFERLDPRIRTVTWISDPDVLSGTTWKLRILRWRVVLTSTEDKLLKRVFESAPIDLTHQVETPVAKLETEMIPGEVKLRLIMDPESPDSIIVRVDPNRGRVLEGRDERSARREVIAKNTPKDKDGRTREPMQYRREKLARLQTDDRKDERATKKMKEELDDLEKIERIAEVENLLTKPAHAELSVVIGLEIDDSTTLEIAKIGEFAN